jgi:hypothetical protein
MPTTSLKISTLDRCTVHGLLCSLPFLAAWEGTGLQQASSSPSQTAGPLWGRFAFALVDSVHHSCRGLSPLLGSEVFQGLQMLSPLPDKS